MKTILTIAALALSTLPAQAATQLGFDELREACMDPVKFQNQVAPRNIQVTCESRSSIWQAAPMRAIELPRSSQMTASVTSDKYECAPSVSMLDVDMQKASCPQFKEAVETMSFTKATTCEELVAFEGNATEYCSGILDQARQSNPRIVQTEETGNLVDLCAASSDNGQKQSPNHGQRRGNGQRGNGQR